MLMISITVIPGRNHCEISVSRQTEVVAVTKHSEAIISDRVVAIITLT